MTIKKNQATFEKFLRAIQAFGGELVVAKGAQQLRNQNIGLVRRRPFTHISSDHRYRTLPLIDIAIA